jgi:hypothetical protein
MASQATAVLGTRGSGKSNLGRVMAEECFSSKVPFVVFDPIGNWYGIRAGRARTQHSGLPVPIFGGEHFDVPLERSSGPKIADLVLDKRLSCVLDMSHPDFSETDKRRFLVEFGDRLFRRKRREAGWLLLILEEADDYAPQSPKGPQAECLSVFQRIVKRGRFKGLGALMLTQRSAAINKDLLNMIGTLVAFRTTAPLDREAVEKWLKYHGQAHEVAASLSGLKDGEGWVWSPEFLGSLQRLRFRRMTTFDTGATPEHGEDKSAPATLADIDVPALTAELQAAVDRAKAEDPRELRAELAKLRAELKRKNEVLAEVDERTKRINAKLAAKAAKPAPAIKLTEIVRIEKALDKACASMDGLREKLNTQPGPTPIQEALDSVAWQSPSPEDMRLPAPRPLPLHLDWKKAPPQGFVTGKVERAILTALATYGGCSRGRLTLLSGYRWAGSFSNALGRLRTANLIDGANTGTMYITAAGEAALGPRDELPTPGMDLVRHWLDHKSFGKVDRTILTALVKHPRGLAVQDLLAETGYKWAGSFSNALGRLRTAGVLVGRNTEVMRVNPTLLGGQE